MPAHQQAMGIDPEGNAGDEGTVVLPSFDAEIIGVIRQNDL